VALRAGDVLVEADRPVGHVWFIESGLASLVAVGLDGDQAEVASIGPEGLAGSCALQGAERSPFRTFVQLPGVAIRIQMAELQDAMEASPALRDLLGRYLQIVTVQIAHTALANGRYSITERLARWILMCHDRSEGDTLRLTHDLLATTLGVRRPGVTTAIHVLEGEGLIKATRGQITVVDRAGLEDAASASYGRPEAEYERLIGGEFRSMGRSPEPGRFRVETTGALTRV
jgi:CRP-like cAMP-binding protein